MNLNICWLLSPQEQTQGFNNLGALRYTPEITLSFTIYSNSQCIAPGENTNSEQPYMQEFRTKLIKLEEPLGKKEPLNRTR